MTTCTATRLGEHDYSKPPHNTPDTPCDSEASAPCQVGFATGMRCQHQRVYEIVLYQPGTHEWIRLFACTPCTAQIRARCQVARVSLAALDTATTERTRP